MSGTGPDSIPTSADPRSRRPVKRRALTPVSSQAKDLDALFARPDQEVRIPSTEQRPAYAPPEIVTNVQGSSAGAGSGEFHVYKASRRREYERLKHIDDEVRKERDAEEFGRDKAERDAKDDERTRKNREKREKKMKARNAKKEGAKTGMSTTTSTLSTVTNASDQADENRKSTAGRSTAGISEPESRTAPAGLVIRDDD